MGTFDHIPLQQVRQTPGSDSVQADRLLTARDALDHPKPPVRSLYIHTPFCVHKCHYCDFYSIVDTQDRQEAFCERLTRELRALAPHTGGLPLHTVFVGGGTPSLLGPERWSLLLDAMASMFDLSLMRAVPETLRQSADTSFQAPIPIGEFTVECNPESATPDLMAVLASGGVNRVSVGAQSFNPTHLKTLERWHNPGNVFRAIEAAKASGIVRQSLDLIYAIPGQSLAEWESDLTIGLSASTTHISCYNLTYEPNTAMTARLHAGQFTPIDEELEIQMFELTHQMLESNGLKRYEVSNYAVPEHECRHNMAYWRQEQWLAAGPSASGHVFASHDPLEGGFRWKQTPRLGDYLAGGPLTDEPWHSPLADLERPDPARAIRERLMTGLRLAEGIDRVAILSGAERASPGSNDRLLARAKPYLDRGLLTEIHGQWKLSDEAMLRADGIAADLMRAVGSG